METYSFKPALLAARREYAVSETQIICRTSDRDEEWRVLLDEVDHVSFSEHYARSVRFWRLDLQANGVRRSISLTTGIGAPPDDPDCRAFLDLVDAVAAAMDAAQPGFQAGLGEFGRIRKIWFGLGVISALCGTTVLAVAIADGVSLDRLLVASIGLGFLIVMGLMLMRAYNPWKKPRLLPVTSMAAAVRAWVEPEVPPEAQ